MGVTKLKVSSAALAGITLCGAAHAGNLVVLETGEDLLQSCKAFISVVDHQSSMSLGTSMGGLACINFVKGVGSALVVLEKLDRPHSKACIPGHVEFSQMARVVVASLEARPELLHQPAGSLATLAMITTFPCNANE